MAVTALRFLYASARYSEGLDFTLEGARAGYDLRGWLQTIRSLAVSRWWAPAVEPSLVPLNQEAKTALQSRASFRAKYCPHSPRVFAHRGGERIQSVENAFASACARRSGIEDFRIHDLRHCRAAWFGSGRLFIRAVTELLRHSDIRVTMRYAHLAPENIRAAVSVLEAPESRFGHVDSSAVATQRLGAVVTD
jgi:integrase